MGWVEEAFQHQEKQLERVKQTQTPFGVPLRDGWSFHGMEVSAYPPAGYEWPKAIVNAIHEVAPDCQPVWVTYLYRAPQDELGQANAQYEKFGRHGLARVIRDPKTPPVPMNVRMPSNQSWNYWGFKMQRPDKLETVFKGKEDPRAKDLPGEYVPFGWWVYYAVKDNWREWSIEEIQQKCRDDEEAYYKMCDKRAEESQYVVRDFQRYAQKKLDTISDVELKEYIFRNKS